MFGGVLSVAIRSVWGMDNTRKSLSVPKGLAEISAILDVIDPDQRMLTDVDRLAVVAAAIQVAGQAQALTATLAADTERVEAAGRVVGVPLASWLAAEHRLTRREANRLIGQGRDLARFPRLEAEALQGHVGFSQATTISQVLGKLPDDLATSQVEQAEDMMIEFADQFDSAGLSQLSRHLVEVVDPVGVEEREAKRLEQDLKRAKAARHLNFLSDGHGSTLIRGSLPTLDAAPLVKLVEAYAQDAKRAGLDRLDPLAETVTPEMRRADGLCALAAAHQQAQLAPTNGGDRPRIMVTVRHDQLRDDCAAAGVLDSGERLTAGQLRQLACDAEILPAVLGGNSEILDIGRAQRLVTAPIRTALTLRDRGCVFPGCDAPASVCHAHHLVPWWAGGSTALSNLVLLCPHHHNLVEPSRDKPPEHGPPQHSQGNRWEIRLGGDGIPEVLPPARMDRTRTPRRHQRFHTRLHPDP